MIQTERHTYSDGVTTFSGWISWDSELTEPAPGVMVAHAYGGQGDFEKERAEDLARLGYVGFALDYYGEGRRAETHEQALALMAEVNADRANFANRMIAALDSLKSLDQVNANRVAAIGYCLGGKAVLDLARAGAEVNAVVSLHGVYDPPPTPNAKITAAVLALHGWDDPLCPPNMVQALATEMTESCDDWQILAFGQTGHSFTNPAANTPYDGIVFQARSNRRSWDALTRFLAEQFGVAT